MPSRPLLSIVLTLVSFAPLAGLANEADDQYTVAAGHYAAQRWDLAAEEFVAFVTKYPRDRRVLDAAFYGGEALVQSGQFEEAAESFEYLLQRDPQGRYAKQAQFRAGEAAYFSKQYDTARSRLDSFVQRNPDSPLRAFALPYLGEIALLEDEPTQAREIFQKAIVEYPQGSLADDARFGLAQALAKLEQLEDAERRFEELVALDGEHAAESAYHLGLIQYRSGRFDRALSTWQQAIEKYSESGDLAKLKLGTGWAIFRLERFDEAKQIFAALIDDKQIGIEARYWLGMTLRAQKRWREAADVLATLASDTPQDDPLLDSIRYHAGDSLMRAGDDEAAGQQFDALLQASSRNPWADDALFGKLQLATSAKNSDEVEQLVAMFLERFPESPLASEVQVMRAATLVEKNDYAAAIMPLEAFLATHANSPQAAGARAELALCYARRGRFPEAVDAYQSLLTNHPGHNIIPQTTLNLAELVYDAGDYAKAATLYEQLKAEANPEDLRAHGLAGLAWCHLQQGESQQAAELFALVLDEYPGSKLAAEAGRALGQILEKEKRPQHALEIYHQVIRDYPQSEELPTVLLRAARIHDQTAQDQQAKNLYERLLAEYPEYANTDEALYGLGWVLFDLGESSEAYDVFTRLHTDYPKSTFWSDAAYRLAEKASAEGDYDRASALLAQIIEKEPDTEVLVHALYLKGRLAAKQELWHEVATPMTRIVEQHPENALRLPAEYSVAEAAFRMDQFDEAEERFSALGARIVGRKESWLAMIPLRRAQLMAHRHEWSAALELASHIAREYPDFDRQHEADYLIGRCLAGLAQFDAAREAYQTVIRSPRGSKTETAAMAQWMIGETYFHQKNYETARREYLRTEILYAYPEWQAAALLQAGKCHEQLGQWDKAAALYTRLLQRYPETKHAEAAKERQKIAENNAQLTVTGVDRPRS